MKVTEKVLVEQEKTIGYKCDNCRNDINEDIIIMTDIDEVYAEQDIYTDMHFCKISCLKGYILNGSLGEKVKIDSETLFDLIK